MPAPTTTLSRTVSQQATGKDFHSLDGNLHISSNIKIKRQELILLATQLSIMLDSGVTLSDALDAIADSVSSPKYITLNKVVVGLSDAVKSGDNFSTAMAKYPKVFNSMFISMLKASEASGKMAEMLQVVRDYLDFEEETHKQIKSAMTYPFIMALMAVSATGTLMFFVLPRFMKIYDTKGVALPKLTQILVGFSNILGDFTAMTTIITTLIISSIALYYWAGTVSGSRILDLIKIRCPILGTMFIDTLITRSMRILTTMITTGVNLLDTIDVIKDSCNNSYFQQLWSDTNEKIRNGYQLSEAIVIADKQLTVRQQPIIEPGIIQMLRAGEKSGKLGSVTEKISFFYEKKLEASIKQVMTLLEPLMITILGAIIGTITIALLLPVFKISTVVAS